MGSKKKWLAILVGIVLFWGWPSLSQAESVNEKILKILLDSKIVTPEKYNELKKQVEEEEAVAAKLKASAEKKPTEGAKVDFNRGFSIESADGESKIRLSGRLQADFRNYFDSNPNTDSFYIRRARLNMLGTLYKFYDFSVEGEFAQGAPQTTSTSATPQLNDAFMNIHYVPYAQLQVGQFKVPFSMEELGSDNWTDFMERSLNDQFAPSRDQGIMIHGNVLNDLFYYQAGIFNGRKINSRSDVDDQKDMAGRITVAPFSRMDNSFLKDFHIGGSFTTGVQHTTSPANDWWKNSFTTAGGTPFFTFQSDVVEDGERTRLGAELAWMIGPMSLKSEYSTLGLNDLRRGARTGSFDGNAGYVSLGWFITGEHEPWRNGLPVQIAPKNPFVFGKGGGYGAFQVVGRYEWLKMEKALLDQGFVDRTVFTRGADGYSFGFNWYPNDMLRFMLNYYYTTFDGTITFSGTRMDSEKAILARFGIVW